MKYNLKMFIAEKSLKILVEQTEPFSCIFKKIP